MASRRFSVRLASLRPGTMRRMIAAEKVRHVIIVDPDIMSGSPVFAGTRVPVQTEKVISLQLLAAILILASLAPPPAAAAASNRPIFTLSAPAQKLCTAMNKPPT